MDRIEPLPVNSWPKEMREAMAAMTPPNPRHPPLSSAGRPKGMNILGILAYHPELARAFFTFNGHLLRATTLTARQRELLILRVAIARKSEYEWAQHLFLARDSGIRDDEIAWVAWGSDAPFWSPLEAALLSAVDEMVADGAISARTLSVLTEHLDAQQVLDVIFTVGAYETLGYMLNTLGVELDDDVRAALTDPAD